MILLDCPGWGKSDSIVNSGSRSDLNARILKSVVDQLDIAKIHLLGNSMGGHSSVAFTLNWPERVGKLVLMGGGTGGMSLFTPMPTEGIKRLNQLYRQPTIENLKLMMDIFVFDTSDLTDALFEARLNNMLSRRDHLENFVKSLEANPKQFPDFGPRLAEIKAQTLIVWGATTALCRWMRVCVCCPALPVLNCISSATVVTGRSGNMPTLSINWC